MTCEIVSAGAIDWCGTHDKPLTNQLEDGTKVCRMNKSVKPLRYIPPQYYRPERKD